MNTTRSTRLNLPFPSHLTNRKVAIQPGSQKGTLARLMAISLTVFEGRLRVLSVKVTMQNIIKEALAETVTLVRATTLVKKSISALPMRVQISTVGDIKTIIKASSIRLRAMQVCL